MTPPALKAAGWGVEEGSRIQREYQITQGRIEGHGRRGKAEIADYVLVHRNTKLAVVEAKAWDKPCAQRHRRRGGRLGETGRDWKGLLGLSEIPISTSGGGMINVMLEMLLPHLIQTKN